MKRFAKGELLARLSPASGGGDSYEDDDYSGRRGDDLPPAPPAPESDVEVGRLDLSTPPEELSPPPQWEALLVNDSDVRNAWFRQSDLPSASEYDMSLANYAARLGLSDQEIADVLRRHRWLHGDRAKTARGDGYYRLTIQKARAWVETLEDPDDDEPAGAGPAPPSRAEASANAAVERVRVFDSDPPEYEVTVFGRAIRMSSPQFTSVTQFRRRVFEVTGRWPKRLKQDRHEKLLERWVRRAEVVHLGDSSDYRAKLEHVRDVLEEAPTIDLDDPEETAAQQALGSSFLAGIPVREDTFYVSRNLIRSHVNRTGDLKVTPNEMSRILRDLGFGEADGEPSVPLRVGDSQRRFWPYRGPWPPPVPDGVR